MPDYNADELVESCPWCWQDIALPVEPSCGDVLYSDCTVCCRPLVLRTWWRAGGLESWRLERGE